MLPFCEQRVREIGAATMAAIHAKSGAQDCGHGSLCWVWQGSLSHNGYAYEYFNGRVRRIHRVAFEAAKGPIPQGMVIDHLCRVRACVNPEHLEAVSVRENTRRGQKCTANRAVCKNGHALTPDNIHRDRAGFNRCLTCRRATWARYNEKNRRVATSGVTEGGGKNQASPGGAL